MIILRENSQAWNVRAYEWVTEALTIDEGTDPLTDLSSVTGFTTLFGTVKRAHHIVIETTGTIYVRLNSVSNDVITIGSSTPFEDHFGITDKIFISTANVARTITVKLS